MNQVCPSKALPILLAVNPDLGQFKEHPESWTMVDSILKNANYPQTKCWCL